MGIDAVNVGALIKKKPPHFICTFILKIRLKNQTIRVALNFIQEPLH